LGHRDSNLETRPLVAAMNFIEQQQMFVGVALLCAGIGSIHDVRDRRIPNRVTGSAVAVGLMVHTLVAGWGGLGESALAGLIAGGTFLVFLLAGGMGAGDVKLMIAVGCIAGLSPLGLLVASTAVFAGALALAVAIYHGRLRETLANVSEVLRHHSQRGLEPHPEIHLSSAKALRLPFALPVAAGCLFTFCVLTWEAHS
jgi:prepilin peptidase CpaA